MFKRFFATALRVIRTVVTRFLDNAPVNLYETVVFDMLRSGAVHFGRERIVHERAV